MKTPPIVHKDGITSKEFALLKAKEMQQMGINTKVEKYGIYYRVLIVKDNPSTSKSGFEIYQDKIAFMKENNIPFLRKNGKVDRTKDAVDKAIAKFKAQS